MSADEGVAVITMGFTLVIATMAEISARRRQRETLRRDRELADIADLRVLLDDAAIAIETSRERLDDLILRFYECGKGLSDAPRDELAEARRSMIAVRARLTIRPYGNGPVVSHFEMACCEISETLRTVRPADLDEASDDIVEEKLVEVELSRMAFEEACGEFTTAALQKVGANP